MTMRAFVLTLCSVMVLGVFSLFSAHKAQTPAPTQSASTPELQPKPAHGGSPDQTQSPGVRKIGDRFAGALTLRTKDNQLRQTRVAIADWIIRDHQKIERFSEQGLLIFHLRAGEITTIINDQRKDRKEDDFWTVPAGTTIGFETDRDTASLQVWTVQSP